MSNLDMSEAIGMLAQEKGISEDTLLHVLVDALASAYKRRPDAADEVVVEVNPETMEFSFIAYDVDEDGNWVNERDDTPKKEELGRIAAQTFRQVMSQRIREVESERKFEEYANREGDIVTMWMRIEYRDTQSASSHRSALSRDDWDCRQKRRANIATFLFRWNNLDDDDPERASAMLRNWEVIEPGTLADTLLQFACSITPTQELVRPEATPP